MDKTILEFDHIYSLTSKWQQKFIDEFGCTMITDHLLNFPQDVVDGAAYFMDISPDIAVVVIDVTMKKKIRFTRMKTDEDFWIIYYDLSERFNRHEVNDVKHKIGYKSKLSFGIIDNKTTSSYVSEVGNKSYSFRLLISKKIIKSFFEKEGLEKSLTAFFKSNRQKMFFYGHIDSRSKLVLHDLKKQNMAGFNYEFRLKNATYNLLAYFFERLTDNSFNVKSLLEKDVEEVMKSQDFLLSDLLMPFPGVTILAEIANMSVSKFSNLYKNIYGKSPALFFKIEKLELAKELLENGDFKSVSDLSYALGYKKTTYFSSIYKNYFGVLPNTVRT
ncbi:helix-turn-helix transcriptional regulator [Flavobacterium sp. F-65]|uniref:Helix-turn-helix transcriptional regulator n=1 Tax=Flavobacterium pisciphilum TaxID=2893755 RepID=A0ABS8N0B7_9FLAO|nr:helix-turn-helix transcriptional regulator [Flavobacterium sp. F-65]MCC9074482.1 helix-turn-helix transcriptional regulator [Flavobacterium sp. F-65]